MINRQDIFNTGIINMKLLTIGSNTKIRKSDKIENYITTVLNLAPAKLSGHEVCRGRSKGCTQSCLNVSGHGYMKSVQDARIRKTKFFFEQPTQFKQQLLKELQNFERTSKRKNKQPVARLNCTSDLDWHKILPEAFDLDIIYYDYTKVLSKMRQYLRGNLPSNYYLTFSRSENNDKKCKEVLELGGNIAAVFADGLPKKYFGKRVINGDLHDLRFRDSKNVVVGLTVKGIGKHDTSGFVIGNK